MNTRLQGIGMTSKRTRERMVNRIRQLGVTNAGILDIMLQTPRHIFVEEALASRAYEDTALPIGFGQTISQPYIVARMTELLVERRMPEKILEIGTGSGYQTAILAQLSSKVKVFTVERIFPLQQRARKNLEQLSLRNIRYKHSDGGWGWSEYAPYDAIIVTAAPSEIPQNLLLQLSYDGVMVIPVGQGREQRLQRVTRAEAGFAVEEFEPVVFVPMLPGQSNE